MITGLRIEDFDITAYTLKLLQIDTFADPDYPDEGEMLIRVEGIYGKNSRLKLIAGVVPHARQKTSNLVITADGIPEESTVPVIPQMQSIPMNHKFVLVWKSSTPYFLGIHSGEKYRL